MAAINQDAPSRNSTAAIVAMLGSGAHKGRPRSDRAHRAILEAAREQLIKEGYSGLRLEHVAAHAGVGKATVYRRWRSKEQLAQALLADLAAPHIAIEVTGDTREEMLAAVMNRCWPSPSRTSGRSFGIPSRRSPATVARRPVPGDRRAGAARRDRRMIARGIERGDLCPDADADIATELLVGPVYFRLMFGGELDRAFAERVVDNVMRGYSATERRAG